MLRYVFSLYITWSTLQVISGVISHCVGNELDPDELIVPKQYKKMGYCEACEMVVTSFLRAMDLTVDDDYDCVDIDWKMKQLHSYQYSEVRLTDIEDIMCGEEVGQAAELCQVLVGKWEDHLEKWFLEDRRVQPDLRRYLCVDRVGHCFPEYYPRECAECLKKACSNKAKYGHCLDMFTEGAEAGSTDVMTFEPMQCSVSEQPVNLGNATTDFWSPHDHN